MKTLRAKKPLFKRVALGFAAIFGMLFQQSELSAQNTVDFNSLFSSREAPKRPNISRLNIVGGGGLVLDRSNPEAILLQYDGSNEVWVLKSSSGPRGDEFLRNDIANVVLRITTFGSATLFTSGDANGKAASFSGSASAIPLLESKSAPNLQAVVDRALYQFSGHILPELSIEAPGLPPVLVQDALLCAHTAVSMIAPIQFNVRGRRFKLIRIVRAPRPYVTLRRLVLEIGVTPGIGYSGRPSSAAIRDAIINQR